MVARRFRISYATLNVVASNASFPVFSCFHFFTALKMLFCSEMDMLQCVKNLQYKLSRFVVS